MGERQPKAAMKSFRQLRWRAAGLLIRGTSADLAEAEDILSHIRDRQDMLLPEREDRQARLHLVRTDRD